MFLHVTDTDSADIQHLVISFDKLVYNLRDREFKALETSCSTMCEQPDRFDLTTILLEVPHIVVLISEVQVAEEHCCDVALGALGQGPGLATATTSVFFLARSRVVDQD